MPKVENIRTTWCGLSTLLNKAGTKNDLTPIHKSQMPIIKNNLTISRFIFRHCIKANKAAIIVMVVKNISEVITILAIIRIAREKRTIKYSEIVQKKKTIKKQKKKRK